MKTQPENDPILLEHLEVLRATKERDPHAAAAARAMFLVEARNMVKGVSPRQTSRLNNWMTAIGVFLTVPPKMRGAPMFNTVLTLIVVAGLTFGGGTVAAQTSQPDDTLYPLKIWSEQSRISLSSDPQTQFELHLQFAARRMEEIQTMLQAGEMPAEAVLLNLQTQMETALHLVAQMPDDQLTAALMQLQAHLQEQDQSMAQLGLDETSDPALLQICDRIRTMLQEQLHLCLSGLESPEMLREQLRNREQNKNQNEEKGQNDGSNQEQNQNQNQQQSQDGNLNQKQNQNQNQEQEQNQNQEEQNQNQYQNGNDDAVSPGNGNGTGPGDGTCPNCPCDGCDGTGPDTGNGSGGTGGKP